MVLPTAIHTILLLCFTVYLTPMINCQMSSTQGENQERILVGYLPAIRGTVPGRQGISISGAINLAIERINNRSDLLPGVVIDLVWNDTEGDPMKGTRILTEMISKDAVAFFGPEFSCAVEATIAGSWNRIMISYLCSDGSVSDKIRYPTFARTSPPDTQVVKSVVSLMSYYNWNIFQIIVQSSSIDRYLNVAERLQKVASNENTQPNQIVEFPREIQEASWFDILKKTKERTRIYVFIGEAKYVVEMMSAMDTLKMFDVGEYLVIYIDMETYDSKGAVKYLWRLNDSNMVTNCRNLNYFDNRIGRSLLVVAPSPPNYNYEKFSMAVTEFSNKPPFNFKDSLVGIKYRKFVSIYAANLYDSVFLYANALDILWMRSNRTENIHQLAKNGREILNTIIDMKSYDSITGARILIDENGDAEGNYSVIAYINQSYQSSRFTCDFGMFPVANFHSSLQSTSSHPKLKFFPGKMIGWDIPPSDSPKCGFNNEHCKVVGDGGSQHPLLSVILISLVLLISLSAYFACRRKWVRSIVKMRLTHEEIHEFHRGRRMLSTPTENKQDYNLENLTKNHPYDTSYELDSNTFLVDRDSILGQGQFGIVYKGTLKVGNKMEEVAFKSAKSDKNTMHLKSLLSELKLMIYIGNHPNIIRVLGAYTRKLNQGIAYVALEFCQYGSLERFLHNSQHSSTVTTGALMDEEEATNAIGVTVTTLMQGQWSTQIAKGMDYLASKKIVHADLATRNILVTSDFSIRVTDFGLSRKIEHYEEYLKKGEEPLPWRWMAPESLEFRIFSTQSDVWSFGVTLWEIYSMGSFPYVGKSWTTNYIHDLKSGERLTQPQYSTDEIYLEMSKCWALDPSERPTFKDIGAFFQQLVYKQQDVVYIQ